MVHPRSKNLQKSFKFGKRMILQKIILASLVAFQVIGPSWLVVFQSSQAWAQQGASTSQARIAGLRGVVTVIPGTKDLPGYSPNYRSSLAMGDVITTEEESVAELLIDNQGLLTVQEYSEAMLGQKGEEGLTIDLQVGAVEWSLPLKGTAQKSLTVSTPNIRATTDGGLITAEVQPTLGDTAKDSVPRNPFLIRTSLQAQSTPSGKVALLETFCVKEGTLYVDYPGQQAGVREHKEVPLGQCVGFFNGALRAMGDEYQIADWRTICAVGQHCEIPEEAKKLIKKKQMAQALALERALVGTDSEDGEVDEQVILATTAANFGGPSGPNFIPQIPQPPCQIPGQCDVTEPPRSGGGGGDLNPGTNIQTIGTLLPPDGVAGGPGLLTFVDGSFTADKELLIADNGFLADAPHFGKTPQNDLVVKDLSPEGSGSPSNQQLPLNFSSHDLPTTSNVLLGVESMEREEQAKQLAQFARSPLIDPDNILSPPSLPENGGSLPCQTDLQCFENVLSVGDTGSFENPDPDSGVDASIQVRSASSIDPTPGDNSTVTLKKGVVLVNTRVELALQQKTQGSFSGLPSVLGLPIQSSAISILGEPQNPAVVNIEDRALAILDGSRIESESAGLSTSLLAVLDGTLRGPTDVPSTRADVPPVIEVIDGDVQVSNAVFVGSTSTSGLDQTLLEASSPLIAMIRGTLTTDANFGRVAGQNAKLVANLLPGDALVSLNSSSMVVNGNLFSVTAGGSLMVNGNLVFLNQGSSLTLNGGVLASVLGPGSNFSLTNGALVEFGAGTNTLNISNNLCAGGGCFNPFPTNPSLQVAGDSTSFSAPPGYNPFVGLTSTNTVNIGANSAILEVQGGGDIQIQ